MHEFLRGLAAVLVAGLAFTIVLAAAAFGRALIHAFTARHGRHELGELEQPSEADVDEFLESLPPWDTAPRPAIPDPSMLPLPSAGLFHAAHGYSPVVVADVTTARPRYDDGPARVLPACSCGSYSHWQADHDTAGSKLHGPQPEPETTLDVAESTFVKALFALPLDRVHEAFAGVRQ